MVAFEGVGPRHHMKVLAESSCAGLDLGGMRVSQEAADVAAEPEGARQDAVRGLDAPRLKNGVALVAQLHVVEGENVGEGLSAQVEGITPFHEDE